MAHVQTAQIEKLTNALPLVSKTTDGNVSVTKITGSVEVGALAVADTVAICRIPQNAKVTGLIINNDALGTTLTIDVGLFQPTESATALGTAIDADAFTPTPIDVSSAVATEASLHRGGNIDNVGERLWEIAGLSVINPDFADMTLAITCVTSGTPSAGTISYEIEYTV